jgi:hypothetical protein
MKTVIILGMHRSGTSCLAGSLQASALELGEVFTSNPHNKKGNRESEQVMNLHESLLERNSASWHQPKVVQWDEEHRQMRDRIIEGFRPFPLWGFKDPRTCFSLSGWLEVLPDVKLVGTFRNPTSVAQSLLTRNRKLGDLDYWFHTWEEYNRRLLAYWREKPFPVIDFDQSAHHYLKSLKVIYRELGLRKSVKDYLKASDLKGLVSHLFQGGDDLFFDPSLRSHVSNSLNHLPESTAKLYRQLKEIAI